MSEKIEQVRLELEKRSAELVELVFRNRGARVYADPRNEQGEGFEHVFGWDLGSGKEDILIVSSRVIINDGAFQLEFDDEGNMQFSDPWIAKILKGLPPESEARLAVEQAPDIITAVAGRDSVTGEFKIIKVSA